MAGLLADRELADAVEADLRRFYGVDIRDLYIGRLRVRQACVFIRGLPSDALVCALVERRESGSSNGGGEFANAAELAGFIATTKGG